VDDQRNGSDEVRRLVGFTGSHAVILFNAGRLWADNRSVPQLDGNGLGLKYGAGTGLSLQSGTSFLLRADIAVSPDATPISGYFSAGQTF
jgi:hypothetical protein